MVYLVVQVVLRLRRAVRATRSAINASTRPPIPTYIAVSALFVCSVGVGCMGAMGFVDVVAIEEGVVETPASGTETVESMRLFRTVVPVAFATLIPKYSLCTVFPEIVVSCTGLNAPIRMIPVG